MTSQRKADTGDQMYFGRPHSQLANAQHWDIFKTAPSWYHPQLSNRHFSLVRVATASLDTILHQLNHISFVSSTSIIVIIVRPRRTGDR